MVIRRNKYLDKLLFCPEDRVQRSAQLWHTAFSVINAVLPMLILFLVTRMCGSEQAGIFSLAFSIAYLMIMIGNYGVGNYQATDVNLRFGFREYRKHRWATCSLMVLASVGYVWFRGYAGTKAQVVLLCCFLKLIESVENVYRSEYQRANRLDVANKVSMIRIALCILMFVVVLLISGSPALAFLCMDLIALVSLAGLLAYTYPRIPIIKPKSPENWKRIFMTCLPLFLSTFFYMYLCNASKYALDIYTSEEIQGYFGMIFAPVSAIYLISNCIYGPFLVRLAEYWSRNQMKPLKKFVMMQTVGIMLIGALVSTGGYLLGTQVLSLVFGVDLVPYRLPLTILLAGSGMTALVDFTSNILTVIRKQKIQMYIYAVFAFIAFLLTGFLVRRFGITGGAIAYAVVMTGQAITLLLFVVALLKKGNSQACFNS